ncbi:MAG: peptide chain release factor N(5)-glutamine methyltransferase [Alkaliphilus sp.]
MVTVEQILKKATQKLKKLEMKTPQLDAEVILCNTLGVDRIKLHIYPEMKISQEMCRKFWIDVEKRENNMPVQYIVNLQEFMGLDFLVEKGVLIPRADTELLVEESMKICKEKFAKLPTEALEIGVGSGAISVSLAKFIDEIRIKAIDISKKALEVAKKNAKTHGVDEKIEFLLGDIFAPITNKDEESFFDIIVSNPPYISNGDIETLIPQVKDYEPLIALVGGEDGLDFYRNIIAKSPNFLKDKGWLVLEIGYDQGCKVSELMEERGFKKIVVKKDLAGHNRLVIGEWQNDMKCDNIEEPE